MKVDIVGMKRVRAVQLMFQLIVFTVEQEGQSRNEMIRASMSVHEKS